MAHIYNAGYATVDSNPNSISTLQSGHKIKIAISEDGEKVWRYVASNNPATRWVQLDITNIFDSDWLKTNDTTPLSINDNIYTNGNVGIDTKRPIEQLHVNGTIRQQTPNNDASINFGIADFHDGSNITNPYYHIKLPYIFQTSPPYNSNGGHSHWNIHVTGSSNGADTAIDIRYMGFLFSPVGIRNNSETVEHNNTNPSLGVLKWGSYISATDNSVVLWFLLSGSNQTRFRVDSIMAGTLGNILSENEVTIIQSTNPTI